MKASELIALLQQRIEEHGDIECTTTNEQEGGDDTIDEVRYCLKSHGQWPKGAYHDEHLNIK